MPIYLYQCRKCVATREVMHSLDHGDPVVCRKCGSKMRKLFSPPQVKFNGAGFYSTDKT